MLVDARPPTAGLTHKQILVVFSGLMAGMLLAALDQTIVATALPTLVGELGGQEQLAWVVSATLLASTVSTPVSMRTRDPICAAPARPSTSISAPRTPTTLPKRWSGDSARIARAADSRVCMRAGA